MERVRESAALEYARAARTETTVREMSIAITSADRREHPPVPSTLDSIQPASRATARAPTATLTSEQHSGLCERGEVLGLAVAVLVRAVGGPARDPDREEREERRHEIGARVQRLRHEPEAAAREARCPA